MARALVLPLAEEDMNGERAEVAGGRFAEFGDDALGRVNFLNHFGEFELP